MTQNRIALGEVCRVTTGQSAPQGAEKFGYSGHPFIRAGSLDRLINGAREEDFERISDDTAKKLSMRLFPAGTVVFAKSGMSAKKGRVYRLESPCYLVSHLAAIIPGERISPEYLVRWFEKNSPTRLIANDAYPSIRTSDIQRLNVYLPSIQEQRRIAAILDKADAIRRKRQKQIREAEGLLSSIFIDMFGDPVRNPKKWPIVPLERLCTRITDGTHQPPKWADEGIPFLFVSNIAGDRINFGTRKFISESTWRDLMRHCPVEVNDILYTTVGSYGNAALVESKQPFSFQRHIAHIKPNPQKVEPEFLAAMLHSDGIRTQAHRQARGVAQKTLNLRELKAFQVFDLPHELQRRYVSLRRAGRSSYDKFLVASKESESLSLALGNTMF